MQSAIDKMGFRKPMEQNKAQIDAQFHLFLILGEGVVGRMAKEEEGERSMGNKRKLNPHQGTSQTGAAEGEGEGGVICLTLWAGVRERCFGNRGSGGSVRFRGQLKGAV